MPRAREIDRESLPDSFLDLNLFKIDIYALIETILPFPRLLSWRLPLLPGVRCNLAGNFRSCWRSHLELLLKSASVRLIFV
jgi:hypothetical protein